MHLLFETFTIKYDVQALITDIHGHTKLFVYITIYEKAGKLLLELRYFL